MLRTVFCWGFKRKLPKVVCLCFFIYLHVVAIVMVQSSLNFVVFFFFFFSFIWKMSCRNWDQILVTFQIQFWVLFFLFLLVAVEFCLMQCAVYEKWNSKRQKEHDLQVFLVCTANIKCLTRLKITSCYNPPPLTSPARFRLIQHNIWILGFWGTSGV